MDRENPTQSTGSEEGLLHVQEASKGAGKPTNGPFASPQDGTSTTLLVHGSGSVWATLYRRDREQTNDQKNVGRDLRVHRNLPDTRGDS